MDWTAYIGDNGAIYFQARFERAVGERSARPLPDQVSRVVEGETFEGRSYEEWRAYLDAGGGAASVRT